MAEPAPVTAEDLALWTWCAPHPDDGGEVAHLLVTPRADGLAAGMTVLAQTLGLHPTGATLGGPAPVPVGVAWGAVAPTDRLPLFVVVFGGGVIGRPVDSVWRAAAVARRMVLLTVGTVPAPGPPSSTATGAQIDVPTYVRSGSAVSHGLLALS